MDTGAARVGVHVLSAAAAAAAAARLLLAATGRRGGGADSKSEAEAMLSNKQVHGGAAFKAQNFGPVRWLPSGEAYTLLEPTAAGGPGLDIVRYDARSGAQSTIWGQNDRRVQTPDRQHILFSC